MRQIVCIFVPHLAHHLEIKALSYGLSLSDIRSPPCGNGLLIYFQLTELSHQVHGEVHIEGDILKGLIARRAEI